MKPSPAPIPTAPVALIGDIHGCAKELEELLGRIGRRRVISLGDVLDRGPDPGGSVELLRRAEAEVLLGNHEDKHFRYRRHEARRRTEPSYKNPMQLGAHHFETARALSEEAWQWLETRCVPYIELPEHRVLAVHAGLHAGVPARAHRPDRICRVQLTKPGLGDRSSPWGGFHRGPNGEPELTGTKTLRAVEEGHRWWTEYLKDGTDVVVYGHSVMPTPLISFEEGGAVRHTFASGESARKPGLVAVGIDTGVPFGGALTALLLPEWTFVRVDAKAKYYGGAMDEA
jgi:hypothetical protein